MAPNGKELLKEEEHFIVSFITKMEKGER